LFVWRNCCSDHFRACVRGLLDGFRQLFMVLWKARQEEFGTYSHLLPCVSHSFPRTSRVQQIVVQRHILRYIGNIRMLRRSPVFLPDMLDILLGMWEEARSRASRFITSFI
jgi:hypothetical protein